ncbi:MAG: response regulator transcription factor [Methylococcales bacterium]|jgi:two-component system, OmpR family, response regulator|nr:response regulator transcription factor [Methylococcales bacterium]MBT7444471.1 response regulator transcription factor [Methylococcales bacterium]
MDKTLLIADDDPHIRDVLRFALQQAGYGVIEACNGEQALTLFQQEQPDLLILDIMMPELDGTEVCRKIRQSSDVPVFFLSAKDDEFDRILGLELGGDDYITKPFSPRELVARVKGMLRRLDGHLATPTQKDNTTLEHKQLHINLEQYKAYWDNQELIFTVTESGILRTLLAKPNKVFSRDELMNGAYDHHAVVSDRTIDSHVRRIRSKFKSAGGDPIETVHGIGYTLS